MHACMHMFTAAIVTDMADGRVQMYMDPDKMKL